MTIIELGTIILLAVATAYGTWRLLRRHRMRETNAGRDPRSASFASAAASTLLAMKVDPLVGAETVIYLPVGDGLYMSRTSSTKARSWRRTLTDWLHRGAIVNVIVTIPNEAARDAWQRMEKDFPDRFHYYELDRNRAPPELASEIAKLDTYHPILVVNGEGDGAPGAMWIEQYHPIEFLIRLRRAICGPGRDQDGRALRQVPGALPSAPAGQPRAFRDKAFESRVNR